MPNGHALAANTRVRVEDLEGQRVLNLDAGHCLRDPALSICQRGSAGAARDARDGDFRATSVKTLRHMVGAGMGLTLLPALALHEEEEVRPDVAVRAFESPAPGRKMALAWRKTHPRAKAYLRLAEFIRANVREAVRAGAGTRECAREEVKRFGRERARGSE